MKKIVIISILILSVIAVTAQDKKLSRKERKAQREAMLDKQTNELIESRSWRFDADQMLPSGAQSRNLTTPYNVVLKDGKVNSYLPFFGRAYTVEYGATQSPMTFESPVEEYSVEEVKKGGYIITFSANNNNDKIIFSFHVSASGSTTLHVNSTNRQHISYNGDLGPIEEEEE